MTVLDPVDALSRSTDDGTLELVYQPEVDLQTGAIGAMEGLLRWRHAHEALAPGDFLELAESVGQSSALGYWVLRAGAAEAAAWRELGVGPRQLWLNVNATQVRGRDFAGLVADVVQDHDLPDGALGLQVNEHTVRLLGLDATPVLRDLRAAGVAVAVDGFASWYSSLGAIALLPLSAVKLGRQHVRGIDTAATTSVAGAVVEVAHAHGMQVVAEGVETWGEAARLTELGCDRAHGWLFSSAQRSDKARWLLTQGTGWRGSAVTPSTRALPSPRSPSL